MPSRRHPEYFNSKLVLRSSGVHPAASPPGQYYSILTVVNTFSAEILRNLFRPETNGSIARITLEHAGAFRARILAIQTGESMGIEEQYHLLEIIADKEARVFRAVQTATGKPVLVHQLITERTPGGCVPLAKLVFLYSQSPLAKATSPFLDMGDFGGHVYVATEDAEPFMDLRTWLSAQLAKTPPVSGAASTKFYPASPLSTDSKSMPPVSESTARFSTPREVFGNSDNFVPRSQSPGETPTIKSSPARQSSTETENEQLLRQGEMTPTSSGGHIASSGAPDDVPPPPAQSKREPGEFTRMYFGRSEGKQAASPEDDRAKPRGEAASTPTAPPAEQAAEKSTGPGEFTRMFSGMGAAKLGEPAPASTPGKPASLSPPGTSPPPGLKHVGQSPPATDSEHSAGTKSARETSEGHGEFTRMFSAGAKPATPPTPESVSKNQAPAGPGDKPASPGIPEGFEVVFRSRKQQPKSGAGQTPGEKQPAAKSLTPQSANEGPGTFTRFFHSAGPPAPQAPPAGTSRENPPVNRPQPPGESQHSPSEFTRMFNAVPEETVELPVDRKRELTRPTAPSAPSRAPSEGPGEFTRMFSPPQAGKLAGGPPPVEHSRPSSSPLSPPASPKKEPGEFTRMFQAPSASQNQPETFPLSTPSGVRSNSPAAQQGPGEFTSIMQGYKAPRPATSSEPAPIPPAASVRPDSPTVQEEEGEFTGLFQAPQRPVATPPTSPPQIRPEVPTEPVAPSGPGEYTMVISGQALQQSIGQPIVSPSPATVPSRPAPAQPMQVPVMPPVQMPQGPAPMPQGYAQPGQIQAIPGGISMQPPQVSPVMPAAPGQFQPSMQPFNVPAGAPQWAPAPTQPSKKPSLLPLIIILGSIFVATVGLILYFALRH